MKYHYHKDGISPMADEIFVFGSNLAGVHGAGAARFALEQLGAVWGVSEGMTGKAYAIPTKDEFIQTLPLDRIENFVKRFIEHAKANSSTKFLMTRVGCVLAGWSDSDIAVMFRGAPTNIDFPEQWKQFLE